MSTKKDTVQEDQTKALTVIKRNATKITKQLDGLKVTSDEENKMAYKLLQRVSDGEQAVLAIFEPQRKSARQTLDIILEQKKASLTPYVSAKKIVANAISDYEVEKDEKDTKAQAKLQEKLEIEQEKAQDKLQKKLDKLKEKWDSLDNQQTRTPAENKRLKTMGLQIEDLEHELQGVHTEAGAVVTVPETSTAPDNVQKQDDWDIDVEDPAAFFTAITAAPENSPLHNLYKRIPEMVTMRITPIKDFVKTTGITDVPGVIIKKRKNIGLKKKI